MAKRKYGTVGTTAATVTIDAGKRLLVWNRSSTAGTEIAFTTNGTTPVIDTDDTYLVGAGQWVTVDDEDGNSSATTVKIIASAASTKYMVEVDPDEKGRS